MVDLVGICLSIMSLLVKLKDTVDTFGTNLEECNRICKLVETVQAIVEPLKQTQPNTVENKGMSAALEGLEKTLERSLKDVERYQEKGAFKGCPKANSFSRKLRVVYDDILANVASVNLAISFDNRLMLTGIKNALADLRARNVHLDDHPRQEVKKLADICRSSTEFASDQNEKKRGTKETDVASRSEVKNEKHNVPAADIKAPRASLLTDGSAKSTSAESAIGQDGPSIANKMISRSTEDMTCVTSIDVHPTEPWIVTGHKGGNVCIWDYQKQETVMKKLVTKEPRDIANFRHKFFQYIKENAAKHWVCSAIFITRKKWLAVGDGSGYIHVYNYNDTKLPEVKKFKAPSGKSVDLLAVHPTKTYLLSSSAYGRMIDLWDWSIDWKNEHEFDIKPTYPDGVLSLKFNPRDNNTFACVTDDERVMVGNINSYILTTNLEGISKADYFFTRSDQQLMVTLSFRSHDAEIRDLETGKVVHTLGVSGRTTRLVAGHPTLPILVTALDDGTVCLWDASTYRLENEVHITDEPADDLTLVTDVNGKTRLAVTSKSMIAIMEVNLPMAITCARTGGGDYG